MIINATYNYGFVVASILVSIATAYCCLDLGPRIRAHEGLAKWLWTGLASFCLGGGIWSMHFIGMLAYQPEGTTVEYDLWLTLLSFVLPVIAAAVGFPILQQKDTLSWARAVLVGAIFGVAVCAMHYTGMWAMEINGTMHWNWLLVALSYVIATGASIAAVKTSFVQASVLKHAIGAVLLGVAISGMHYTGMWAMTMTMGGDMDVDATDLDPTNLGTIIALITMSILGISTMAAQIDKERR